MCITDRCSQILTGRESSPQIFEKQKISFITEISPVGAVFYVNGETEMTELIVTFLKL